MSHNASNVISKPVDFISDIAYVLGSAASDVGDLGRMITNGNIRPWAKYKPTRMHGLAPADWWKGEQKSIHGSSTYSCGFSIVDYDTLAGFKAALDDATNEFWKYEKPRGNSVVQGEWFRALDFDGYDPRAICPFRSLDIGHTYNTGESATAALTADFTAAGNAAGLGVSDFGVLAQRYFGVAIYDGNGNLKGVGTAPDKLGDALNTSLRCPMTMPDAVGTYYIYPFFSYQNQAWSATNQFTVESFIPLPSENFGKVAVSVVSNVATMSISGSIRNTGTASTSYVSWDITLKAKALEATTFNNLVVRVGIYNSNTNQWLSYHDYLVASSVTVAAGQTLSITSSNNPYSSLGTINWLTADINGNYCSKQDFYNYYENNATAGAYTTTPNISGVEAGLTKY